MFTFAQIREAILSIDESIIDEELAANLIRFAPVKEDVCILIRFLKSNYLFIIIIIDRGYSSIYWRY